MRCLRRLAKSAQADWWLSQPAASRLFAVRDAACDSAVKAKVISGQVNGTLTIQGLTLNSLSSLDIMTSNSLTLRADGANDGIIRLNDTSPSTSNSAGLVIRDGVVALNGSGKILFASPNQNAIGTINGGNLILGANQTITTNAGAVGSISVPLVNNGTIDADAGTIHLAVGFNPQITNNNLIRARNAGFLTMTGISIDNTNGTITIDPTSSFNFTARGLAGHTILGGGVNGGGTINVNSTTAILNGTNAGGLTLDSVTVKLGTRNDLVLTGNITNNATIRLNDADPANNSTNLTFLTIVGDTRLDGTGSILFDSPHQNFIGQPNTGGHSLTLGANQTLATNGAGTAGSIGTRFVNNGVVEANGGTLTRGQISTHNNLIQARNGGTLNVNSNVSGIGRWVADGGKIDVGNNDVVSTTGDVGIFNGGELELSNSASSLMGRNLTVGTSGILDVLGDVTLSGNFSFGITKEAD